MNISSAFETIGVFIVSLFFISIPILCTLSFVYDWFGGLKLILIAACLVEWVGLVYLLIDVADNQD